jgi:hypothetical protein
MTGKEMAYKISIKTTITADPAELARPGENMTSILDAVAGNLDHIEQETPAFLGFTLSSNLRERTAIFNIYTDENDPEDAVAVAHAWVVTAINAAGDSTSAWMMYAHPEERERISA